MFTAAAKIDVRAMVVESGGERVSAAPLVVRNQTGKIALALPKSAAGYRWHEDDYLIIDCEAQQNSKANVKYEFKIGDKLFTMGYYLVPKRRVKMAIQLAELASRRWFLQTRPGAMKGHVSGSPTHIDKVDEVRITVEKGREPQSFTLYDAYLSRELPDFTVKGAPMVDQFGQWKDMDWAGKVKDEAAMVGFLRAEYDRALRDHDYPGDHTQDKPGSDGEHVDQHDVFQPEGIRDVQDKVCQQNQRQRGAERQTDPQRQQRQDDRRRDGPRHWKLARGQRPLAFARVQPVPLDVDQIVDDVDRAGGQTQQRECQRHAGEWFGVENLLVEQDSGVDKSVFRPLLGPHGADQAAHGRRDGAPQRFERGFDSLHRWLTQTRPLAQGRQRPAL